MQLKTLELGNSLLSNIKKAQQSIDMLEKLLEFPNNLNLNIPGNGTIPISKDIKEGIIKDTIKKLGIQKAQLQAELDELDDTKVQEDEDE